MRLRIAWWGALQCSLTTGDRSQGDYSSISLEDGQQIMFMQLPMTFTRTTNVRFKCHLCGVNPATDAFKTATLRGAKIYAVQVGSVEKQ